MREGGIYPAQLLQRPRREVWQRQDGQQQRRAATVHFGFHGPGPPPVFGVTGPRFGGIGFGAGFLLGAGRLLLGMRYPSVMETDQVIRAIATTLGVFFYVLLIEKLKAKQAACRTKHRRGLAQSLCYCLGRFWAVRYCRSK